MKKGLFLLATAALVLAGCNNDVTLDENTALVNGSVAGSHAIIVESMGMESLSSPLR